MEIGAGLGENAESDYKRGAASGWSETSPISSTREAWRDCTCVAGTTFIKSYCSKQLRATWHC
jgi:hypothetical protein